MRIKNQHIYSILLTILALNSACLSAVEPNSLCKTISVISTGMGNSKVDALMNAFSNAIRQCCSFYMRSQEYVENDLLLNQTLDVFAQGQVISHKILKKENKSGKILVVASVEVSPEKIRSLESVLKNKISTNNVLNIAQQIKYIDKAKSALRKLWSSEQFDSLYSAHFVDINFKIDEKEVNSPDNERIYLSQKIKLYLRDEGYKIHSQNTLNIMKPYALEQKIISYDSFIQKIIDYKYNHKYYSRKKDEFWVYIATSANKDVSCLRISSQIFNHLKNTLRQTKCQIYSIWSSSSPSDANKPPKEKIISSPHVISVPSCYTLHHNAIFIHPFLTEDNQKISCIERKLNKSYSYLLFKKHSKIKTQYCFSLRKHNIDTTIAINKNPIVVTVSGLGETPDAAEKDAIKEGISQAIGCFIEANSLYLTDLQSSVTKETVMQRLSGSVKKFKTIKMHNKNDIFICEAEISILPSKIYHFLHTSEASVFSSDSILSSIQKKHELLQKKRNLQQKKYYQQLKKNELTFQKNQELKQLGRRAARSIFRYIRNSTEANLVGALKMNTTTRLSKNEISDLRAEIEVNVNTDEFKKMMRFLLPEIEKNALFKKKYICYTYYPFSQILKIGPKKWNIAIMNISNKKVDSVHYFSMPDAFTDEFFTNLNLGTRQKRNSSTFILFDFSLYDSQNHIIQNKEILQENYPIWIDCKAKKIILAPTFFSNSNKQLLNEKQLIDIVCNINMQLLNHGDLSVNIKPHFDYDARAFYAYRHIKDRTKALAYLKGFISKSPMSVYPLQIYFSYFKDPLKVSLLKEEYAYQSIFNQNSTQDTAVDLSLIQQEYYYFYKRQAGLDRKAIQFLYSRNWRHSGLGIIPYCQSGKSGFNICYISPQVKNLTKDDVIKSFNGKKFSSITELMEYLKKLNAGEEVKIETSKGEIVITLSPLDYPYFMYQKFNLISNNSANDLFNTDIAKLLAEAKYGNINAQYQLGKCYYYGVRLKKSFSEAVKWFEKAASQNCLYALYYLAKIYQYGPCDVQNSNKAKELLQRTLPAIRSLAENGSSEAQFLLGVFYDTDVTGMDCTEAVKWYQQAVNSGNILAYHKLAFHYKNGNNVAKDPLKAFYMYERAAIIGFPPAQQKLGECYYYGIGATKDFSKAVYWFEKAAKQGDGEAQFFLGVCYSFGEGVSRDLEKSVKWHQMAAAQGIVHAQLHLGIFYQFGIGCNVDLEKAAYWYKKAALQENSMAQYYLGTLYYTRQNVKFDSENAVKWLRRASEKGNADALIVLLACHTKDKKIQLEYWERIRALCQIVLQKNREHNKKSHPTVSGLCKASEQEKDNCRLNFKLKAQMTGDFINEIRIAAEKWDTQAQFCLGLCYEKGIEISKDMSKAISWIGKAARQGNLDAQKWLYNKAKQGNAEAQYLLGLCYDPNNTKGQAQPANEAFKWYQKAAAQGHIYAQYRLKNFRDGKENPDAINKIEYAFKKISSWAEQGDSEAQYRLGESYYFEMEKGIKWLCKAAEQGHAEAQHLLADRYQRWCPGDNLPKAIKWLHKAAEKGYVDAQKDLSRCYSNGYGVEKNDTESFKWQYKAAEKGNIEAQNTLGFCYEKAFGVEKNWNEALKWYRRAAMSGDADAQYRLGKCYYYGNGVAQDIKKAFEWYKQAAKNDEYEAIKVLREHKKLQHKILGYGLQEKLNIYSCRKCDICIIQSANPDVSYCPDQGKHDWYKIGVANENAYYCQKHCSASGMVFVRTKQRQYQCRKCGRKILGRNLLPAPVPHVHK